MKKLLIPAIALAAATPMFLSATPAEAYSNGTLMTATTTVNIRQRPTTNSKILGTVNPSTRQLYSAGTAVNGWQPVKLASGTAYISVKYLRAGAPSAGVSPKPVVEPKAISYSKVFTTTNAVNPSSSRQAQSYLDACTSNWTLFATTSDSSGNSVGYTGYAAIKHNYCGGSSLYSLSTGQYVKVNGQGYRVSKVRAHEYNDWVYTSGQGTITFRTCEQGNRGNRVVVLTRI